MTQNSLSLRRLRQSFKTDPETQLSSPEVTQERVAKQRFLDLLLGQGRWTNQDVLALTLHLENRFQGVTKTLILHACDKLELCVGSASTTQGYVLLTEIMMVIMETSGKSEMTLDNLARQLYTSRNEEITSDRELNCIRQVVFAAIGLITLTFSWVDPPQDSQFAVVGHLRGDVQTTSIKKAERKLGNIFGSLGILQPSANAQSKDDSTLIFCSKSNLYSLMHVGHVEIHWTKDISAHLVFDASSHQLKLFCFPSFCALHTQAADDSLVFDRIYHDYMVQYPDFHRSVHREVLMTLRIILGQDSRSRKLFRKLLLPRMSADTRDRNFDLLVRKSVKSLPIEYWPKSCVDLNKDVIELGVYDVRHDLPIFGHRLINIQQFMSNQTPRTVREIWRDRRSAEHWYTFWAVIILGGLSLLLSLLQLGVTVAQLVTGLKPLK